MTLNETSIHSLLDTAAMAAEKAGEYIQGKLHSNLDISKKQGIQSVAAQVVTEVDIHAQNLILEQLKDSIHQFKLGVLTEESADDHSRFQSDYFWCIDPLDGTLAFSEGQSGYAVSIALISRAGLPILAAIYVPDKKECYTAVKGKGVFLNRNRFLPPRKDESTFHLFLDKSHLDHPQNRELMIQLESWIQEEYGVKIKQHLGSGAVCNALGVMQYARACYFKKPKEKIGGGSIWDFAATHLIFEELELAVSNSKGERLRLNERESTFMNKQGVIYASDEAIYNWLIQHI